MERHYSGYLSTGHRWAINNLRSPESMPSKQCYTRYTYLHPSKQQQQIEERTFTLTKQQAEEHTFILQTKNNKQEHTFIKQTITEKHAFT